MAGRRKVRIVSTDKEVWNETDTNKGEQLVNVRDSLGEPTGTQL